MKNYYNALGVLPDAEFDALRKAYRSRAMECHPDRFDGDLAKAEEFKLLVEAFNVLTDPVKRRDHDLELGVESSKQARDSAFVMGSDPADDSAILDTLADDILEELIVGNSLSPRETTLATLMLDLEQTEQFCLFREAKTRLYQGATVVAEQLFRDYLAKAPANILARYFLAKCCRANGHWREAQNQLALAIRIGGSRTPPLRLIRLRRELSQLRNDRPGLAGVFYRLFGSKPPKPDELPAAEQERRALNRAINRLASSKRGRRRVLPEKSEN